MNTKNKEHFDFSDHKCNKEGSNKNKSGCFKDELFGVPMQNFIALNHKVYCFDTVENEQVRKTKGMSKVVFKA